MIWEPFVLAVFLGLVVSAGLYFAYLWPSVEPADELATDVAVAPPEIAGTPERVTAPRAEPPERPSDADLTPLPPPAPEDDGLS